MIKEGIHHGLNLGREVAKTPIRIGAYALRVGGIALEIMQPSTTLVRRLLEEHTGERLVEMAERLEVARHVDDPDVTHEAVREMAQVTAMSLLQAVDMQAATKAGSDNLEALDSAIQTDLPPDVGLDDLGLSDTHLSILRHGLPNQSNEEY